MPAIWMGADGCESPIFTGYFDRPKGASAAIDISGLGYFELYVNGARVSEDLFVPAWSDYGQRWIDGKRYPYPERISYRVYYVHYDLTPYLMDGKNKLEVWLGNGFFNQHELRGNGKRVYGTPRLWYDLTVTDADGCETHFESDDALVWRPSPITYNNIYLGERQNWLLPPLADQPAVRVSPPGGVMVRQTCEADKVMRTITPTLVSEKDGVRIYDADENIAGFVALTVRTENPVSLRFAEELSADGTLNFESSGSWIIQKDEFTAATGTRVWPRFVWHGFRYFEIAGEADDITVCVVHMDIPVTGEFTCSNDVINHLFDAYKRTKLANLHGGIPSDCPHRERLGYTGDGQAVCGADLRVLSADLFYRKWMGDIADSQCTVTGRVSYTAPFEDEGGGPGGWGGAMVIVPYLYYLRYRDETVLKTYWPNMLRYIEYLESRMENGLVVRDTEGRWCLGDWCPPDDPCLPAPLVNTYYYVKCLQMMTDIARILDYPCDALYEKIEAGNRALLTAYYDEAHNTFASGLQGADAYMLDIGLGDDDMARAMAARYDEHPWFDTGFLATPIVIRQLFMHGYADTAVRLLSSEEKNHSFGWQKMQGATTLWEYWDGRKSHSHPMFGGCVQSLFDDLLGVQADGDQLVIAPALSSLLSFARGALDTRFGCISVDLKREDGALCVSLCVPVPCVLRVNDREIQVPMGKTIIHFDD